MGGGNLVKIEVLRFFFTFFCQIADQPFKKGAFFSKRHLITPLDLHKYPKASKEATK